MCRSQMIEETNFKKALKLYKEAINLMEEDGKDTLTGDMFRYGNLKRSPSPSSSFFLHSSVPVSPKVDSSYISVFNV